MPIDKKIEALAKKFIKLRKKRFTAVSTSVIASKARSRGANEQKAMFAKMGASGKLRGKGPSGKRDGDELPASKPKKEPATTKQQAAMTAKLKRLIDLSGGSSSAGRELARQQISKLRDIVNKSDNDKKMASDTISLLGDGRPQTVIKNIITSRPDVAQGDLNKIVAGIKSLGLSNSSINQLTHMLFNRIDKKNLSGMMAQLPQFLKALSETSTKSIRQKFTAVSSKSEQDAIEYAKYRSAGPASTQVCQTCKFKASERLCALYDFAFEDDHVCNSWLPNIKAMRTRQSELRNNTEKAENLIILRMIASKARSRGTNEQKAMFAKMGASGKLRGKGPSGKRDGDELPASKPKKEAQNGISDSDIEANKKIMKSIGRYTRSVGTPDNGGDKIAADFGRSIHQQLDNANTGKSKNLSASDRQEVSRIFGISGIAPTSQSVLKRMATSNLTPVGIKSVFDVLKNSGMGTSDIVDTLMQMDAGNVAPLIKRATELTGKSRTIHRMIANKAANYSARAGQPITQNLRRGNDGEFESTGQSDTAQSGLSDSQMDALKLLAQGKNIQGGILAGLAKLGLVDKSGNLTANGKTAVSHIESGDIGKIKSLLSSSPTGDGKPGNGKKKPKGKKGGGGGKKKKPTKEEIRAENLAKVSPQILKAGISQVELNGIVSFSSGGELSPAVTKSLVSKGLLSVADGKPTTNRFTRSFLSGIDKGNSRVTIDAIRQAKEAMIKAIAREEAKKKKRVKKSKDHTPPTFTVFKDTTGRPRWLAISSSSYRDKDNEIVSLKSIETAVAHNDNANDHGPLRWWHVEGVELGTTDLSMVMGRMLVESGTFKNAQVARRVQQNVHNLGMSIGFKHPITEPDNDGVFHNINIFERSLLPRKRASNHFTKLTVKGENAMATQKEKLAQLANLLGDGEVLQTFISSVQQTDKDAYDMGVAHKEESEPTMKELWELGYSMRELLNIGKAYKEAEAEILDESPDNESWEDETKAMSETESKADGAAPSQANRPLTRDEFNAGINRLAAMISGKGQTSKEANAEITAINARLAELEATKEALQLQLDEINGLQPRALSGYRASQQATPTETPHGIDEATKELQELAASAQHPGAASMLGVAKGFADIYGNNGTF